MNKKIYATLIGLITTATLSFGQTSRQEFIQKYYQIAIAEMERTGIPASITLAQGILESSCGDSPLATKANNFFGIKCHNEWNGETFYKSDDKNHECFRKYNSVKESFDDHSDFLCTRERYASLFKLSSNDYKGWAKGLKKAGYATNPEYAERLIKIIEDEGLHQYDAANFSNSTLLAGGTTIFNPSENSEVEKSTYSQELVDKNNSPYTLQSDMENYNKRIEYVNGLKCIKLNKDDSVDRIAEYFGISKKMLTKFNELKYNTLSEEENFFLEPKKVKADKEFSTHTVQKGETIHSISQMYGIKMSSIVKFNKSSSTVQFPIEEGDIINLREKQY